MNSLTPDLREEKIITLLRARDERGMEILHENYSGALYHLILKLVRYEAIAEEVLQDVLMKVWDNIHSYDKGKSRFFTWMARIARNAAIDSTRSRNFKATAKSDSIDNFVHMDEQLNEEQDTDKIGLKKLLDFLDDDHRKILELLYFQDFSQSEVGKELDLPLGTVKTRSRRAILQLREFLKSDMLKLMVLVWTLYYFFINK